MEMAMARLDDKGRVVIPKRIRDSVGLSEKSVVFVYTFEGLVFLRKIEVDKKPVLENLERPGLTALAPSNEPRHSRELVIWALARRPVMTFRQLRRVLIRWRGSISYQGTWKLLRELLEDGQIKKLARNEYVINPGWIQNLRAFCNVVERNHRYFQIDEEVIVCQK